MEEDSFISDKREEVRNKLKILERSTKLLTEIEYKL
jgi:hypothetical protein